MTSHRPRRRRPPLAVALYAHPFELALGAALIVNGIRGFLGDVNPAIAQLPALSLALYLTVSTLGGVGLTYGLVTDRRNIERASLYLVAASYAAIAILILTVAGWVASGTALVALVVGGACVLRAHAIRAAARIVLAHLVTDREDREGREGRP